MKSYSTRSLRLGLVMFFLTLALSIPLAVSNLRYLYLEDDGHHINHTIEMAQQGTLNPNYFNKPALHFYLRMPFVYAGAAIEKLRGTMTSIREIRTRDPYGAGRYAFTPSHPAIIAWLRIASLLCNALLPVLVLVALTRVGQGPVIALFGAALTALSPEVLGNSFIVGVDTLMALVCLSCSVYAMLALTSFSRARLFVCALLAGLSCAAKYNAAPIAIVPAALWWFRDRSVLGAVIAAGALVGGFLAGAPYTLISYEQFWKGITYEAWHYSVAGHEGNDGARGFPQLVFYTRWLLSDGVGVVGALLAAIGVYSLFKRNRTGALTLVAFPLAYTAFMACQKVNFTRNMVTIVPFVAIYAACGLSYLLSLFTRRWSRAVVGITCAAAALLPLTSLSTEMLVSAISRVESRDTLRQWLQGERPRFHDVALAGPLQAQPDLFHLPGVDAYNPETTSLSALAQAGYDYVVAPTGGFALDGKLFSVERAIPGEPWPQRIARNPAISILSLQNAALREHVAPSAPVLAFTAENGRLAPTCQHASEPYCWISTRISRLEIPRADATSMNLTIMSPWPNQRADFITPQGETVTSVTLPDAGVWRTISLPPASLNGETSSFLLVLNQVRSPASQGISQDNRRLGLAFKRQS